jgi:hypothetical protein
MQNLKRVDYESADAFGPVSSFAPTLPPTPFALADGSQAAAPSPALALQQRLLEELAAEAADDDGVRWSPRTTMLFAGAVSLGLWGLLAGVVALFH